MNIITTWINVPSGNIGVIAYYLWNNKGLI